MSAKLRNRVCIHKDYKELADKLDMTIFPQEIGGKMLMTAMIKHFKQRLQKNRDIILSNDMMDILTPKCMEWFENSNLNEGASGSFRKIEFD